MLERCHLSVTAAGQQGCERYTIYGGMARVFLLPAAGVLVEAASGTAIKTCRAFIFQGCVWKM